MSGRRAKKTGVKDRQYVGIEKGLSIANREYISIPADAMEVTRKITEVIVRYIVQLMREESPAFDYLYAEICGGGSAYEGVKICKPDEFDIDILMRIPSIAGPVLLESNIPGYVKLRLDNFHRLKQKNLEVYNVMQTFVDEKNYLLTKSMKGTFMQSVFDRTMKRFPKNIIPIGTHTFRIKRVQSLGPALTLTLEGPHRFQVSIDLVPCIVLDKSQWPGEGFKRNPCADPELQDFLVIPKSPKRDDPHIDRYWRLSFQRQETSMIFHKQWLKPTLKILKGVRDYFGQKVSSYTLKTIFLWKLKSANPDLWQLPLSYCVVHMLEVYSECLFRGRISYFWNKKLNLLEDLSDQERSHYHGQIEALLKELKDDPKPESILKYFNLDRSHISSSLWESEEKA